MKRKLVIIFIILCVLIVIGYTYFKVVHSKFNCFEGITTIEIEEDSISIGKISFNDNQTFNYKINNIGNFPLVIYSVKTSCGCTAAKYDKKPIPQGKTTSVVLEYKPNSLGYFSKTADVVCNVPEGYVRLKISGEVVEK